MHQRPPCVSRRTYLIPPFPTTTTTTTRPNPCLVERTRSTDLLEQLVAPKFVIRVITKLLATLIPRSAATTGNLSDNSPEIKP